MSPTQKEPIVVWGAGAIGGTLGAYWARAGLPVLLVDIAREHVEACRSSGLRVVGPVEKFTQVVPAATPDELKGVFRRVVLAVKAPATEAATLALAPHLAQDGYVLSAQNGLNEIAIAKIVGPERTMGCFVNFGADWHGPGRILYGNRGAVVVGEIDGKTRDRTREMHALLKVFEPEPQRLKASTTKAGKRYNSPAAAGVGRSPGRHSSRPKALKRNRAMIPEKKSRRDVDSY